MLNDNKKRSKVVRKYLFDTFRHIDKLSKIKVYDSKNKDNYQASEIITQEETAKQALRAALNNTRESNPHYVYRVNYYAISKVLLQIFKSEGSKSIIGINFSDDDNEDLSAAKGLIKDIYLKDNRDYLQLGYALKS